jgi:hypothetical protein
VLLSNPGRQVVSGSFGPGRLMAMACPYVGPGTGAAQNRHLPRKPFFACGTTAEVQDLAERKAPKRYIKFRQVRNFCDYKFGLPIILRCSSELTLSQS